MKLSSITYQTKTLKEFTKWTFPYISDSFQISVTWSNLELIWLASSNQPYRETIFLRNSSIAAIKILNLTNRWWTKFISIMCTLRKSTSSLFSVRKIWMCKSSQHALHQSLIRWRLWEHNSRKIWMICKSSIHLETLSILIIRIHLKQLFKLRSS